MARWKGSPLETTRPKEWFTGFGRTHFGRFAHDRKFFPRWKDFRSIFRSLETLARRRKEL